jgi:superfamily II DNA or RNA helicase
VSFFGVRQVSLVDMPGSAGEFVQRVGRAVRFNGHAGLPAEKSTVRVRMYCATLPGAAGGESEDESDATIEPSSKSADEQQADALKVGLEKYDKELRKLYAVLRQPNFAACFGLSVGQIN